VFSLFSVTKYAEIVAPQACRDRLERVLEQIDKVGRNRMLKIINGRNDEAR
jgi:hypothetical protein